jgi:hypothetical protein
MGGLMCLRTDTFRDRTSGKKNKIKFLYFYEDALFLVKVCAEARADS